jgi:hypothetical protein
VAPYTIAADECCTACTASICVDHADACMWAHWLCGSSRSALEGRPVFKTGSCPVQRTHLNVGCYISTYGCTMCECNACMKDCRKGLRLRWQARWNIRANSKSPAWSKPLGAWPLQPDGDIAAVCCPEPFGRACLVMRGVCTAFYMLARCAEH